MSKFVELSIKDFSAGYKRLIPISSITSLKSTRDGTLVLVSGLQLYAEDYYTQEQYKSAPAYIETEAVETTNDYNALKFLLELKPKEAEDTIPF